LTPGRAFPELPDDYKIIEQLRQDNQLTMGYLQSFSAKAERITGFSKVVKARQAGTEATISMNGGGRNVFSAADTKIFSNRVPIQQLRWKTSCFACGDFLAENKWAFRLHATYDD